MIQTITTKWAVRQPMKRGTHLGTFPTREEAQAVADAQSCLLYTSDAADE